MRFVTSALLMIAQLRPLFGLVLCFGLGTAKASPMEEECPMGGATAALVSERGAERAADQPTLTAAEVPTGPHTCAFADACTPVTTALVSERLVHAAVEVVGPSILRSTDPVPDQARFAPPTPPPNA